MYPQTLSPSNTVTILIVEDEDDIRSGEVAYLKNEGYVTLEASTGREALEIFSKNKIDLVLLDINIPQINGIEVCRKVRDVSNIPIIMITARTHDEDEVKAFNLGVNDYIKKPFNPNVFIARVKAVLKDTSRPLKVLDLTIDPVKASVLKGNKPIKLTKTQFQILLLLARKPGVVFSREGIIDSISSIAHYNDVLDRSVDAHIKRLRKCLGDSIYNSKYIVTVPGRGYRFNND